MLDQIVNAGLAVALSIVTLWALFKLIEITSRSKCDFCDADGNQYYWSCWICGAIECKRQARAIYSLD